MACSTRIRTFYNSLITLPNSNLISSSVDNYGARQYRRWSTKLAIRAARASFRLPFGNAPMPNRSSATAMLERNTVSARVTCRTTVSTPRFRAE